jgi:hypothetical protein
VTCNDESEDLRAGILIGLSTISPPEHGANLGEGRKRPYHWDGRGLLLETITEPDEEDVDESAIFDGVTDHSRIPVRILQSTAVALMKQPKVISN